MTRKLGPFGVLRVLLAQFRGGERQDRPGKRILVAWHFDRRGNVAKDAGTHFAKRTTGTGDGLDIGELAGIEDLGQVIKPARVERGHQVPALDYEYNRNPELIHNVYQYTPDSRKRFQGDTV